LTGAPPRQGADLMLEMHLVQNTFHMLNGTTLSLLVNLLNSFMKYISSQHKARRITLRPR
jgi:cell division protein FtsL